MLVLFEILITLAMAVVLGTIVLLVWATWFKPPAVVTEPKEEEAPPAAPSPPAPTPAPSLSEAVMNAFEYETGPLPPAIQVTQTRDNTEYTVLYIPSSNGTWLGGRIEGWDIPAVLQEAQVRALLVTRTATPVSQEQLNAVSSRLNEDMSALMRDVRNFSLGGMSQAIDRVFTSVTVTRTTRTVGPTEPKTDYKPKTKGSKPAPAPATEAPSRLDRLLSDDDDVV